jgi:methionine-gamma-lyase
MKIARAIESRDEVAWVRHTGLPSHSQYELVRRQMRGPGSMISFELKGGLEAGKTLMNKVRLAVLAVSLGGVETLIEHPASMTHAELPAEERLKAGITDGLVRYSIGIEDPDDLLRDREQALALGLFLFGECAVSSPASADCVEYGDYLHLLGDVGIPLFASRVAISSTFA